jgi:hypothetical protein
VSFAPDPKARRSLRPGTVYAISGQEGWIYWAQVKSELEVGFFGYRSRELADTAKALEYEVILELTVGHPSIGRALRSGVWKKLGIFPIGQSLAVNRPRIHWSDADRDMGHTQVNVIDLTKNETSVTTADDPAIQDLELAAAWDAEHHVPERLAVVFGDKEPAPYALGNVAFIRRRMAVPRRS